MKHSTSPTGEKFPLPTESDYKKEMLRLHKLVAAAKKEKKEIVVVMGVGFVGAVMAAIVADTEDKRRQAHQVRHRLPAPQPAQLLEDPAAQPRRSPRQGRRPGGGSDDRALRPGEEDAHCHVQQRLPQAGRLCGGRRAVRLHQERAGQHADRRGRHGRPRSDHAHHRREDPAALPGPDRNHRRTRHHGICCLADPQEGVRQHAGSRPTPLLAHSFERVMPGRNMSRASATSGGSAPAATTKRRERVEKFLHEVLNTETFR